MASRRAWMLAALPVLALAFPLVAAAQDATADGTNNSCIFAHDGECDEANGTCAPGTDSADCRPDAKVDPANSCRYAFDQRCDEPGRGTGLCAAGTDTADCAAAAPAQSPAPPVQPPAAPAQAAPASGPNDDSCPFAQDGDCDEPGIGSGACAAGTDSTDCKARRGSSAAPATPAPAAGPGDDSCPFARDGDCDEPGIGSGACAVGTDTSDCKPKQGTGQAPAAPAAPKAGGDDSCQFANDGECDEPGRGTGLCTAGTDTTDCSAAGGSSAKPSAGGAAAPAACPFTGDGECDEPSKGSGLCAAGTDAEDCRGR